jgi:predicted dehydrogenase
MVVGLVGCGRWGVNVLRDLLALGCRVRVVARSEASAERARGAGATELVQSLAALGPVDGVVVATPTGTHATVVEAALELGAPIFVEKPLCDDPAVAERLAAVSDGRVFVMDKWRYHPGVAELARIARADALGAVLGLRTIRIGGPIPHRDVDAVWILAPHDLTIALEILGRLPEPVAARGSAAADGSVVVHGLLQAGDVWHALEVGDRSPAYVRRVELHCEGGVAVLADGWDEHVSLHRRFGRGEEERVAVPGELPLLAELRAFVEHLGGGPPPRSSVAEGAAVVRAISTLRALAGLP